MPIAPLVDITINDSDIDEVEKLLGNVTFDNARREAIKRLDTFDVQAFPGTGKTTLLIAKLAILAKKWPYLNRGICVLSHTNVAREEIESRLGTTEIGRKLLSYPHFIGTLHSFADAFIGLPFLRSKEYKISLIDTDITLERRWAKISHSAKNYLERKGFPISACESKDFPIKLEIKCSETAPSYENIKEVVKRSLHEGYFTFDEMLYIARYALKGLERSLPRAIQTRFPILLIDEAQDTSTLQWEIIDAAFPDETLSIINSFGDCNQAIYQSYVNQEKNVVFPRKTVLSIENSKRFSNMVARLANPLSIATGKMVGECSAYSKNDSKHMIFLYEKEKISNVLPAYAEHVLSCFTDEEIRENELAGCHAVGMVHKKDPLPVSDKHFPASLIDYWPLYNSNVSSKISNPRYFVEYFYMGAPDQKLIYDSTKLVASVAKGLRRLINMSSKMDIPLSSSAFHSILAQLAAEKHHDFRIAFQDIVRSPVATMEEWDIVIRKTSELLVEYFEIADLDNDFLRWVKPSTSCDVTSNDTVSKCNCFTHMSPKSGRTVDIQLGSIHSAKGRTHLSTLVLETFWKKHNVDSILPWLCAEPPNKGYGIENANRLRCHYVALTRAHGLICLAIPKGSISTECIDKLIKVGWNTCAIE